MTAALGLCWPTPLACVCRYRGQWNVLPTTYNWGKPNMYLCPELVGGSLVPLKVVHFSGCLKPWHSREPTGAVAKNRGAPPHECKVLDDSDAPMLRDAIARWWAAYDSAHEGTAITETARKKVLFVVHRYYPYQGQRLDALSAHGH